MIGTPIRELVPDEAIYRGIQQTKDEPNTPRNDRNTVVVKIPAPDPDEGLSHPQYYEIEVMPVAPEHPRADRRLIIISNVTEERRYQRRLESQNQRLDEFASIVSHDLRNPLSVADGRLTLLENECDSDHVEAIQDAHDRMATLIDELLTLAREGESVTDPEALDLGRLVSECWATVETGDAELSVSIDGTYRILADETRLKQLFENLFRNAIDHAGPEVRVTLGDIDGGFYLADDGPGIPDSERDAVFEAGYTPPTMALALACESSNRSSRPTAGKFASAKDQRVARASK